jgi:Adenosyl cobinamide kinase/adenosyl cobinamide phosphate guanylyltransferase
VTTALFTGACRSGKSAMAQAWCERHGRQRIYIATARSASPVSVDDAEMAARIAAHQAARGEGWHTLEAAGTAAGLPALLEHPDLRADHSLLLDCTTLWLAGLMEHMDDAAILERVDALALALRRASHPTAVVHNETGWGLVPEYPMGRRFRDLSGIAGQRLAAACDAVVLAVCGLPLAIKGTLD